MRALRYFRIKPWAIGLLVVLAANMAVAGGQLDAAARGQEEKKECHCFQVDTDLKELDYSDGKFLPDSDPKIPKGFGEENPKVVIKKTTKGGNQVQTVEITHVWKKKVWCDGAKSGTCTGEVEVQSGHTYTRGGNDITEDLEDVKTGMVKKFKKTLFKDEYNAVLEIKGGEVVTTRECKGSCKEGRPDPEAGDFEEDVNFATKYEVTVPGHGPFDADITVGLKIECPDGINDGATHAFGHVVIKDGKYVKEDSAHK